MILWPLIVCKALLGGMDSWGEGWPPKALPPPIADPQCSPRPCAPNLTHTNGRTKWLSAFLPLSVRERSSRPRPLLYFSYKYPICRSTLHILGSQYSLFLKKWMASLYKLYYFPSQHCFCDFMHPRAYAGWGYMDALFRAMQCCFCVHPFASGWASL